MKSPQLRLFAQSQSNNRVSYRRKRFTPRGLFLSLQPQSSYFRELGLKKATPGHIKCPDTKDSMQIFVLCVVRLCAIWPATSSRDALPFGSQHVHKKKYRLVPGYRSLQYCKCRSLVFLFFFIPTDVFFSISLALMVASLLETVFITHIQLSSSEYSVVPHWLSVLLLQYIAVLVCLPPKKKKSGGITVFLSPSTRGMVFLLKWKRKQY